MASQATKVLEGSHAVVTGGSRGIGAAVARALGASGARVTLLARDGARVAAAAAAMRAEGMDVDGLACDVTEDSAVARVMREAVERSGPVGILVNNAGTAESAPAREASRAQWDRMLAVNLTATYTCTMQVLPSMLAARKGRIVNVASTAGLRGYKTMTAYCAAKHGVVGYTRALALETAAQGVTVNAVCPGYTETDLTEQAVSNLVAALGRTPEEARAMLVRTVPRGTLTTPQEVADAVVWLCSPGAAAVTGVALPIAGGEIG